MALNAVFFNFLLLLGAAQFGLDKEKTRIIYYGDQAFNTTYDVDETFLGTYSGKKTGYLTLEADGTGVYKYDLFGFAPPTCDRGQIKIVWGFILNDKGEIIRNKRDYGLSYPILLESTGSNSFQGCRKQVMKDYILIKEDALHVSSSDDWKKSLK